MTDDEKLAILHRLEVEGWTILDVITADTPIIANLDIIERCQRIRANLKDKSCKLEVTCPY